MIKIRIPQSDVTLGNDPNVGITCKVILKLHWKNKVVLPAVESMRKQLQAAFNDQAKGIEEDLIDIIKSKKSPGYVKEVKNDKNEISSDEPNMST